MQVTDKIKFQPPLENWIWCLYAARSFGIVCKVSLLICGLWLSAETNLINKPAWAEAFNPMQAERFFTAGYVGIEDFYIERVSVQEIALSGLNGLSKIDPNLAIALVGNSVRLMYGDSAASAVLAPSADDVRGWVSVTTNLIYVGQEISEKLRATSIETIYDELFDALLHDLDRFSRYAGIKDASENRALRDGFGGIGVRIKAEPVGIRLLEIISDTPAYRAGLQANDLILRVNEYYTKNWTQSQAVKQLRGYIGSKVRLNIQRTNSQKFTTEVKRDHVILPTVTYTRSDRVAVLTVTGFNLGTAHSFNRLLEQAQTDLGKRMQGIILDLRGNPGGLLEQAVSVADMLLPTPDMRIVTTRGRHAASFQSYESTRHGRTIPPIPIVVIIDRNSASASEILAAALQDSGRAVLIGSTSYGKGSVQTVISMPNDGELTLTWARLHAPSGYSFHEIGVMPSICTLHSNGNPARSVANMILRNRTKFGEIARARIQAQGDKILIDKIRSHCDGKSNNPTQDMEVALLLLRRPSLYEKARNLIFQSIATSNAGDKSR